MKRAIAILLAILTLVCLGGCQSGDTSAELKLMQQQMKLMQQQLDEAKQAGYTPSEEPEPVQTPAADSETAEPDAYENESSNLVLALHSTIDGETSCIVDGPMELTATADIPEGMAVAYWEVNGEQYYEDMEDTFTFTAQGNTVVDARLRPEFKVTTINAEMQFLDTKGKPKGDAFTEFVFEEDYQHPITKETLPGGWITVNVKAVVPKGYAVDYWLINDVPYYFNRTVSSFIVRDLNETTVYEVVLKKENAPASTPKPTAKPTTAPTQAPVYTPEPTQAPIYYSVNCYGCTFSGGGYSGASSGNVPAGTVITVTSKSNGGYWTGSYEKGDYSNTRDAESFSFTVKRDCEFYWNRVIN